ncbi:unnamed protein product [marine sediment metagenome]|uniref:Uncharacterized protein n=1 Tax=marine sediment metagenome TaxID=412755 RepID=X1GQ10_9ZZZZ
MSSKWKSRKFWMAIGTIVVTIAVGCGYKLDPKLIVILTSSESALWIVIEGILDAIKKPGG